jgi:hypothetical protein
METQTITPAAAARVAEAAVRHYRHGVTYADRAPKQAGEMAVAVTASTAQRDHGVPDAQAARIARMAVADYQKERDRGLSGLEAMGAAAKVAADRVGGNYGTMDVKDVAGRAIDEFRRDNGRHGADPTTARNGASMAVANTEASNGVNYARAARVAGSAVAEYARLLAKGASHDLARNAAARKTAERYDQQGIDRQRQQARGRDVMSL